jgi:enoyl-CoA hydratase/carnithine racemase
VEAGEAFRMGLVTRVVPEGSLETEVEALAASVARNPRAGLAASKAIVADLRAGGPTGEGEAYARALGGAEARQRLASFLARRRRRG